MFEHIFTILDPEMIVWGSVMFGLLILLGAARPEICFALGFPAYIFLGQLGPYLPVSNSASAALFPLATAIGCFFRGYKFHFGYCKKLVIGLALLMAFSIYYSSNPTYGRDKVALFCFMVVPVIVFTPNIITSVKSLHSVVFILVLTIVTYVFVSLLFRCQMGSVAGLSDVTLAGQFLGLATIISYLYIIYYNIKDVRKTFFICVLPISFVLLLMTGLRAAVLAVIVTLFFMHWFVHIDWFKRIFKKPHKTFAMIFLGIFIVLIGSFVLRETLPEIVFTGFTSIDKFFSNFTPYEIRHWQTPTPGH